MHRFYVGTVTFRLWSQLDLIYYYADAVPNDIADFREATLTSVSRFRT
jgi:hypothetical protein